MTIPAVALISTGLAKQLSSDPPRELKDAIMHPKLLGIEKQRFGPGTFLILPGEEINAPALFPQGEEIGVLPTTKDDPNAIYIGEGGVGVTDTTRSRIKTGGICFCLEVVFHDSRKKIAAGFHTRPDRFDTYSAFAKAEQMLAARGVNIEDTIAFRLKTLAADPFFVKKIDYIIRDRGIPMDDFSSRIELNSLLDTLFDANTGRLMVLTKLKYRNLRWRKDPNVSIIPRVSYPHLEDCNSTGSSIGDTTRYQMAIRQYALNGLAHVGLVGAYLREGNAEQAQRSYEAIPKKLVISREKAREILGRGEI